MLRIWLIAMIAAALLVVVRSYDPLHRIGLLASCTTIHAPAGAHGAWRSCRKGLLNGRPDLSSESCRQRGRAGSREYWRCPMPASASPR